MEIKEMQNKHIEEGENQNENDENYQINQKQD